MSNWKRVSEKISCGKNIIFGTGFFAELWYARLKKMGYSISFFCDNNSEKWSREIIDGITCLSPESVITSYSDYNVLICVGPEHKEAIESQLDCEALIYIYMAKQLTEELDFLAEYFNVEIKQSGDDRFFAEYDNEVDSRIAIYTAVFGDYDEIKQPAIIDTNCDYFIVSDTKPDELGVYKWKCAADIIPDEICDNTLRNRFCKMHPHLLFPEYDYSIYLDGNIETKKSIQFLCEKVGKTGIGLYSHGDCDDAYVEAFRFCDVAISRDMPERIQLQVEEYAREGFPYGYGFYENSIIARKHSENVCKEIMNLWWDEYLKYKTRDQLSLMYAVWKNGYRSNDIGLLGRDWRTSSEYSWVEHKAIRKYYKLSFAKDYSYDR